MQRPPRPRELPGVEKHHAEYRQFWKRAKWTSSGVPQKNDVAWVYEIAIAHRQRPWKRFVVYVGSTSNVRSMHAKRASVTPPEAVSFVRAVEINADGAANSNRRAALFVGMCKSDFDYACTDGKRAFVMPTLFCSKLHRIGGVGGL